MPDWFRTDEGTPVPAVTAYEMRAVDRVAVEDVGLPFLSMMENAGRSLAHTVLEANPDRVVVLAGGGGNGGGGLCAARHLHNHGIPVTAVLDRAPGNLTGASATQWTVLHTAAVPVRTVEKPDLSGLLADADLIVDAVVGYGLSGAPRGAALTLIELIEAADGRVISLDVPSGVDATSGDRPGEAVIPDRTLTLALPKTGLDGRAGVLVLADIGIPTTVYERLDIPVPTVFSGRYRVPIDPADAPN